MALLSHQRPRPRPDTVAPAYPQLCGAGLLAAVLGACGAPADLPTENVLAADPSDEPGIGSQTAAAGAGPAGPVMSGGLATGSIGGSFSAGTAGTGPGALRVSGGFATGSAAGGSFTAGGTGSVQPSVGGTGDTPTAGAAGRENASAGQAGG
jgi:hypothetical protein